MSSTCPAAPCLYSNRIQSPLAVQKSPLYQCEVKSAYLAYSVCSEPTPFITTQWPKLFWRRKSGPAGMFPILFLCRLLCREKRSKVKQKPERAKLLHDWHKTVTKDKEDSMEASDYFEEWNGWDKKWNLLGGKSEQCDFSITDYGRHIFTFLGFFLTLVQYRLIYLTRSATLRFTENKSCLKKII